MNSVVGTVEILIYDVAQYDPLITNIIQRPRRKAVLC